MSNPNWDHGPRLGQRKKYATMLFPDGSVTIKHPDGGGILLSSEDLYDLIEAQQEKIQRDKRLSRRKR